MHQIHKREDEALLGGLGTVETVPRPETAFDSVVAIAKRVCDVPIAFVSLEDGRTTPAAALHGVGGPREAAFHAAAIQGDELVVVADVAADPRFANEPLVTGAPGVRFFAGMPAFVAPGAACGSLCVMDLRTRGLSELQRETLEELAALVGALVDQQRRAQAASDAQALLNEQTRELEMRKRRFQQTERLARVGGWVFDLESDVGQLSDEACRIAGFPAGTPVRWNDVLSLMEPDDCARLNESRARAVADGRPVSGEYRIVTPAGVLKWVNVIGDVECVRGAPRRFFGVAQDISEQHQAAERLEQAAATDFMTGLANRARLKAVAEEQLAAGASFGLLLLDLDRLKAVNDTYGHGVGDAMICTVARRLRDAVEGSGMAFRCGGDEFAAIVFGCRTSSGLRAAAQRFARLVSAPLDADGHTILPGVTIGGALSGVDGADLETLSQNADFALFEAKDSGRGGYVKFKPGLRTSITQRINTVREFDTALKERRVVPHYQPIVSLQTGRIAGLEALARVEGPNGRMAPVSEFAAALSDPGIAHQLTTRMLSAVAADAAVWAANGVAFARIAVNVTMADFRKGDLESRLAAIMARAGLALDRITLEVTETVLLDGADGAVARAVKRLRDRGVQVALDDFGTGFASLAHLRSLPIDIIKIDRSFTRAMIADRPSRAIVQALVDLALKLDVKVVAEGVETVEQMDLLKAFGCHLAQGYFFARPTGMEDATRLLKMFANGAGPIDAARRRPVAR